MAEHMDIPMDTSKMSEQELQFHYFKVSFFNLTFRVYRYIRPSVNLDMLELHY